LPAIFPENHATGSFPGVLPGVARFLKTWLYKQHLARHIPALMTILGINYLNVSITALLVIYVFICLFMILLVLMSPTIQILMTTPLMSQRPLLTLALFLQSMTTLSQIINCPNTTKTIENGVPNG
jgi:hypothetical protein